MAKQHDVIVVGAGHNGLIVGAYLAKAGLDVLVLERLNRWGGCVVTEELTVPGFKHDTGGIMHGAIQSNPVIHQDELELVAKYGLKYIYTDIIIVFQFPDGRELTLYKDVDKTIKSIAQFSNKDAEIYRKFIDASFKMLKAGGPHNYSPAGTFGRIVSFADSSPEGQEFLRVLFSTAANVADEWFESEEMKMAIDRWGVEGTSGPRESGTGLFAMMFSMFHGWGSAFPEGGSGKLSDALAACIKDNGGTIRLNAHVKAIKVQGGEAKGVVLKDGEEILAKKAVVSNLNVKQLFLQMLKPEELPPDFQDKVRRIRHSPLSSTEVHVALKEAPKYKVRGGDVEKSVMVALLPNTREEMHRIFEGYSYGEFCPNPMPMVMFPTYVDKTRAPAGMHTAYLAQYSPYCLKGLKPEDWDKVKEEKGDRIWKALQDRTTNMGPENILGRFVMSPIDKERWNPALIKGDVQHIGLYLSQLLSNRPLAGWGQYRTPVKKLYMSGASTHPAGGIAGGGRAAVFSVMEDLGIDFNKVIPPKPRKK